MQYDFAAPRPTGALIREVGDTETGTSNRQDKKGTAQGEGRGLAAHEAGNVLALAAQAPCSIFYKKNDRNGVFCLDFALSPLKKVLMQCTENSCSCVKAQELTTFL